MHSSTFGMNNFGSNQIHRRTESAPELAPFEMRQPGLITNSTMVKHDVVTRYQLPDDKVTVIPNGVDLNRFHPRHRLAAGAALRQQCGWTADHLVLVFLGTGYGRKGLDRLLDVLPVLVEQRPRVRLVVVGHDAHLGRWRERVRRLRL